MTVDTSTGAYILVDGEALRGGTYTSTNADENVVQAEGDVTASQDDVTVKKTDGAASSNDASSFYGLNSAILALDNATLNITGGIVTATAEGANGENATFNISEQVIPGDVVVDSISTLEVNISGDSSFTGSINSDDTEAASLSVTIDSTSIWTLTADSYTSSFNGSLDNVVTNGYPLYANE